jgi:regulator of cell morphogenesis and NO signaling
MTDTATLSTTTVNDLLRRVPAAMPILNRFGVDTCCGGGLPLVEAARHAGVSPDELLAALRPVVGEQA